MFYTEEQLSLLLSYAAIILKQVDEDGIFMMDDNYYFVDMTLGRYVNYYKTPIDLLRQLEK